MIDQHLIKLYQLEVEQSQATIDELAHRMQQLSDQNAAAQVELASAQGQIEATEVLLAETEVAGVIAQSRMKTARAKLNELTNLSPG